MTYAIAAFGALFIPAIARAHVGYVVSENAIQKNSGGDVPFLLRAFEDPANIILVIATLIGIVAIYFAFQKIPFLRNEARNIKTHAESYGNLVPWIIRLSLGIALIGSGTANVLISPALEGFPDASFIQILSGFLFLAGFLLTPITIGALFLYGLAISIDPYLFGNLDFLGLALALFILADPRPGVDDLTGIPFTSPLRSLKKYVPLVARVGIGASMIFLALYEKLLNPHLSEIVVQQYGLTSVIPVSPEMWILSAGIIELVVGLFLLLGLQTRVAAVIAFIVLSFSFFFFKEDVYSHITLFGTLSVILITGGGAWSFDRLLKKHEVA